MIWSKPFKEGEKVWLESKNLHIPYQSRKLALKWEGPFLIQKVLGPVTYQLKLPSQWKIHNVFHTCLLSPYKENDVHRPNHTNLPPNLIDGAQEYEVETLLAHRQQGQQRQYLVKWKGYDASHNTWEPARNLVNAEESLKEYKRQWNLWTLPCLPLHSLHLCHPILVPTQLQHMHQTKRTWSTKLNKMNQSSSPEHPPPPPVLPNEQSHWSNTSTPDLIPCHICNPSWLPCQLKPRKWLQSLTWTSQTQRPDLPTLRKVNSVPTISWEKPSTQEWFQ